jgi:hypothetical protein
MNKYTKTFAQAMQEVRETKDSNYKFDGKVVSISKANFSKVGKDYKNATPGQERMVVLDPKTHGTISAPVKFTEDYEVSMAIGQLKTIQERVGKIMDFLSGKSDDYNMEAWLQSKITSAEDKLNSVANYVTNNPEVNEANLNVDNVGKGDTDKEKELKIKLDKEKDTDTLEKQIVTLQGKLNLVTQKLENEKNRVVKPEPNPETGEVPLRTGIANAILDKKINTKKLVQSKKKKEIKVGGKTAIEINPDKDIGNFSGGMRTNAGNLH